MSDKSVGIFSRWQKFCSRDKVNEFDNLELILNFENGQNWINQNFLKDEQFLSDKVWV